MSILNYYIYIYIIIFNKIFGAPNACKSLPSTDHKAAVVKMKNRNDAPKRRNADAAVRKYFFEINYDFLC